MVIDDDTLTRARSVLLDGGGSSRGTDRAETFTTLQAVRRAGDAEAYAELVTEGFLAGARERYRTHIEPVIQPIPASTFFMGTHPRDRRHYCGELPRHPVQLSAFGIARVPVTHELFALFDPSRGDIPAAQRQLPVVDVTWFDAAVFAAWFGCRLPSEAEWELACAAGSGDEWCCGTAERLPEVAWFSENSGGRCHRVGTREPNALGLFDMHGNVWEWCHDDYAATYYARAPRRDPVNDEVSGLAGTTRHTHKVCRGGGFYALDEMCRTRHRLHDPAGYWALDLGFRVAADLEEDSPP